MKLRSLFDSAKLRADIAKLKESLPAKVVCTPLTGTTVFGRDRFQLGDPAGEVRIFRRHRLLSQPIQFNGCARDAGIGPTYSRQQCLMYRAA